MDGNDDNKSIVNLVNFLSNKLVLCFHITTRFSLPTLCYLNPIFLIIWRPFEGDVEVRLGLMALVFKLPKEIITGLLSLISTKIRDRSCKLCLLFFVIFSLNFCCGVVHVGF